MLTTIKNLCLASLASVGLASCGTLPSETTPPCETSPPSDQVAALNLMSDCIGSLSPTLDAQMPTSGTATYSGFMTAKILPSANTTDAIIGDAVLTANFAPSAGTLSGTISNIVSADTGALGGNLSIGNGTITGSVILGVNLNGVLTGYGSQTDTVTIATTGVGGFMGSNAEGIFTATAGTATMPDGYVGTAEILVQGYE